MDNVKSFSKYFFVLLVADEQADSLKISNNCRQVAAYHKVDFEPSAVSLQHYLRQPTFYDKIQDCD